MFEVTSTLEAGTPSPPAEENPLFPSREPSFRLSHELRAHRSPRKTLSLALSLQWAAEAHPERVSKV